jgi:DNA helicase II / ATP-dependent DNA helicase PcrA
MVDMAYLEQLNTQQKQVCIEERNVLLKACPGSGKTRTLTYKLAYLVNRYNASRKLNVAITYTNRAAEEIKERLEKLDIPGDKVWVGTIHQFCLEFIIRHYTMYHSRLKKGYHIIDEFVSKQYVDEIKNELNMDIGYNNPFDYPQIVEKYQERLSAEKEIDFNDILVISHDLLRCNKFIAENIAGVIRSILVDEYQDTNELQYKILSQIVKADKSIQVTFVGDTDQAIYGGLGGVAKTSKELQEEFGVEFIEKNLDGCYRTTQRIIDYYCNFQLKTSPIYAVSDIKDEKGCLVYNDSITNIALYEEIAKIVNNEILSGVPEKEICIVAPRWWLLFPLTKKMNELLPNVKFDAPDITPIKYDPMNVFYLISRLIFTESGKKSWLRKKTANEIISILNDEYKVHMPETVDNYKVLKIVNSSLRAEQDGVIFLQNAIENVLVKLGITLNAEKQLQKSYEDFMAEINDRVKRHNLSTDTKLFKQCFKEKEGVVINTFHGVKGEEYHTVIAYGILNGYIPHWKTIYNKSLQYREEETKKLLYVVCSRAKKKIYLFSEKGRVTKTGTPLVPTDEIAAINYQYDII